MKKYFVNFITIITSIIIIILILIIARCNNIAISLVDKEILQNLVAGIVLLSITIILIDIYAYKLIKDYEIEDNRLLYQFTYQRLNQILDRIKQKLMLINIDLSTNYSNENDLIININLDHLNQSERITTVENGRIVTVTIKRPVLFYNEINQIFLELELLYQFIDKNAPTEIIEGAIKLISKDSYKWNTFAAPFELYNNPWLEIYRDVLFNIYSGAKLLSQGNEKLNNLIR